MVGRDDVGSAWQLLEALHVYTPQSADERPEEHLERAIHQAVGDGRLWLNDRVRTSCMLRSDRIANADSQ